MVRFTLGLLVFFAGAGLLVVFAFVAGFFGGFAVFAGASGFGALAFQIAWVRLFGLVFGSSVYSFSAVLGIYLLGIALGAALVGRWIERCATLTGFALLQTGLAASAALAVHAFAGLPQRMLEMGSAAGVDWRGLLVAESLTVAAIIGLPCVLLGALFPVTVRLLQSRDGGHAVGTGYALNTVGTIAGSLLAGFVLVPTFGVQGTHLGAVAIALVVGLVAAGMAWVQGARRGLAPVFVVILVLVTGLLVLTAPTWDPMVMSSGVYRPIMARRYLAFAGGATDAVQRGSAPNKLVYYREGINASVILGTDATGQDLWLRVGGKVDASTTDMETQALLGLIPGALADSGSRALVIGLGSGVTAAAVLATGVGPTEIVELEPGVVTASRWFHAKGEDPLDDPRATLIQGDARTHLLHASGRYGLIVSEPSNPWIAGVNNLFTVDFYERVKARLAEVKAGLPPVIPVLQFPDGRFMNDSTPLAYALEREHPERSIVPADPAQAWLSDLLEDFGDEWVTKMMFHYRWYYAADRAFAQDWVVTSRDPVMPMEQRVAAKKMFNDRQVGRMAIVGCTEQNRSIIEDSYRFVLDTLDRHLKTRPFLFGTRPALADFGLYGQLQILSVDPTPMAEMRARAIDVYCWLLRLDDASGVEGQWADPAAPLPETLKTLLAHCGATYMPFLAANLRALQAGSEEVSLEIGGRPYAQAPFRYQAKCYDALRKKLAALPADVRRRLDPVLDESGCLSYLA